MSAAALQKQLVSVIIFGCSKSKRGVVVDAIEDENLDGGDSESGSKSD
jgi:hypothetical protein